MKTIPPTKVGSCQIEMKASRHKQVVVLPKEKQGTKVKLCETGSKEASSSLSE